MNIFNRVDPKFRKARHWSNVELRKIAPICTGDVVNVSGWNDIDKQDSTYKEYFINCDSYSITNHTTAHKGQQGFENEIILDLEKPLDAALSGKFDVVLNHTVLEHVFEVQLAFKNLCSMSKDLVVIVVPFLQEQHGPEYGDFWRFTPLAIDRMMKKNDLNLIYINYNDNAKESIYIIAVGSKIPNKWNQQFKAIDGNKIDVFKDTFIGTKIIR